MIEGSTFLAVRLVGRWWWGGMALGNHRLPNLPLNLVHTSLRPASLAPQGRSVTPEIGVRIQSDLCFVS